MDSVSKKGSSWKLNEINKIIELVLRCLFRAQANWIPALVERPRSSS